MVDLNENTIPNLILSKHIEKTKFNVKIINELKILYLFKIQISLIAVKRKEISLQSINFRKIS